MLWHFHWNNLFLTEQSYFIMKQKKLTFFSASRNCNAKIETACHSVAKRLWGNVFNFKLKNCNLSKLHKAADIYQSDWKLLEWPKTDKTVKMIISLNWPNVWKRIKPQSGWKRSEQPKLSKWPKLSKHS